MVGQRNEESVVRRKSAMLLFSLEFEIGRRVCELSADAGDLDPLVVQGVLERQRARGRSLTQPSTQEIVACCYFDEALSLLERLMSDSSELDAVRRLREVSKSLGFFEIRNACAHPMRRFPVNFWYRAAAICSDQFVQRLGFSEVSEALASAESGFISDPPLEWLEGVRWSIPHNLPSFFDHSPTGLIGRNQISRDLRAALITPRASVIAVVARGGIGKTALVLDSLDQFAVSPEASNWCDRIAFVTMKPESLSSAGRRTIESARTVNEVKAELAEALEEQVGLHTGRDPAEVFQQFIGERVLVCLDNLDTLLRDDPQAFSDLNSSFPERWRVLITSRVTVDGATTVRLTELSDKDAQILAFRYAKSCGFALPNKLASEVARLAANNPLAVKLTVDLIAKGSDLIESARWVESEVSQFSYDNLIEALSDNAVRTLEAVFALEVASRADIIAVGGMDADAAAEALGELTRTSLMAVEREDLVESFRINESVRDFLRINPRNLKFRSQVQEQITKRRAIRENNDAVQASTSLASDSLDYISPAVEDQLAELAISANRAVRQKSRRFDSAPLLARFRALESEYGGSELFWRAYGRVMLPYDLAAAEAIFDKGAAIAEADEPQCKVLRAYTLSLQGEYSKAALLYQELLGSGWGIDARFGTRTAKYVREGLAKALLFGGKFADTLAATSAWDQSLQLMEELAAPRIGAYRQMDLPSNDRTASLCNALEVLDKAVANIGFTKAVGQQGVKVYRDAIYLSSSRADAPLVERCSRSLEANLNALAHYLGKNDFLELNLGQFLDTARMVCPVVVGSIEAALRTVAWISKPNQKLLEDGGYSVVKVINIPRRSGSAFPKYVFAALDDGKRVFVGWGSLVSGNWAEWSVISLGSELIVKWEGQWIDEKCPKSVETHIAG